MNASAKEGSKSFVTVQEIWQDVLGVNGISESDQFLDIGGNSLNVVEVISKIREKSGVSISPKVFFDRSTNTLFEVSKKVDEASNLSM